MHNRGFCEVNHLDFIEDNCEAYNQSTLFKESRLKRNQNSVGSVPSYSLMR